MLLAVQAFELAAPEQAADRLGALLTFWWGDRWWGGRAAFRPPGLVPAGDAPAPAGRPWTRPSSPTTEATRGAMAAGNRGAPALALTTAPEDRRKAFMVTPKA